jgi:hypothetical protein
MIPHHARVSAAEVLQKATKLVRPQSWQIAQSLLRDVKFQISNSD